MADDISSVLESAADSLDELLANQVAESYTKDGYNELMEAVAAMKKAKTLLVSSLSKFKAQNGKAGRPNEYADIFTWQVEQILRMDGLSLVYFDSRYRMNRPNIKLLKFLCECAEFRKRRGTQENRKDTKLIEGLELSA